MHVLAHNMLHLLLAPPKAQLAKRAPHPAAMLQLEPEPPLCSKLKLLKATVFFSCTCKAASGSQQQGRATPGHPPLAAAVWAADESCCQGLKPKRAADSKAATAKAQQTLLRTWCYAEAPVQPAH